MAESGSALQLVERHSGGRAEEGGGAADHCVVDAAVLQVRHGVVQRHKGRRARCRTHSHARRCLSAGQVQIMVPDLVLI